MLGFSPLSTDPVSAVPPSPPRPAPVLYDPWYLPIQRLTTIPSYLYLQYNDDEDLQAFVDAYNTMAQRYVTWFASVGLPIYTSDMIVGDLLDWVAQGLYGQARPLLPSGRSQVIGPLNTYNYNRLAYNQRRLVGSVNYYLTSDDIFKRILTWNYFKGDGTVFSIRWLKRRIMRFLMGISGTNPNIDNSYQISITFGLQNQVNIRILNGLRQVVGGAIMNRTRFNQSRYNQLNTTFTAYVPLTYASIFAAAVKSLALQLPFQFTWLVTIESSPTITGFFSNGGVLSVNGGEGYPTSDAGLPPGSIWSNGGSVSVVPGIVPDPSAPPIYFGSITPTGLLALGGGNLPLSSGTFGSGQLYNSGDEVTIS